jgi:hypothetical protein
MTKAQQVPKSAWVPAGVDPTDLDYPLQGPTVSGCLGKAFQYLIYFLAFYGLVAMWQQTQAQGAKSTPVHDILQTATLTVAPSVQATWTPESTLVILRSDPVLPTARPPATLTQIPTETPIPPGALATWTPGPWMLTRFAATYTARFAAATPTVAATATIAMTVATPGGK